MKKHNLLVTIFCILTGCTNAFYYGEKGKLLDDAYEKYKCKEIACLGKCTIIEYDKEISVDGEKSYVIVDSYMSDTDEPIFNIVEGPIKQCGPFHPYVTSKKIKLSDIGTSKYGSWDFKDKANVFNDDYNKKQEAKRKRELKEFNERQAKRIKEIYKKYEDEYGYPACSIEYEEVFWGNRKNCVFEIGAGGHHMHNYFQVLWQDFYGTFVNFAPIPLIGMAIQYNKTDKVVREGQKIKDGVFLIVGTYDYSTKYRIPVVKRLK